MTRLYAHQVGSEDALQSYRPSVEFWTGSATAYMCTGSIIRRSRSCWTLRCNGYS